MVPSPDPAKRLIIYDLDGTLVDTERDIATAVNAMLAGLGAAPRPQPEIRGFVGRGLRELVAATLNTQDPGRIETAMERFAIHYQAHLLEHSRLYPGCLALLEHFRGRIQVVLTNKPDPFARQVVEGFGLTSYFAEVIPGNSDYPKKPDPAAALALMRRHGASPARTLLIGDSPIDIETGRRAGIFTVVVGHGFSDPEELRQAAPDALTADFGELLELARRAGW